MRLLQDFGGDFMSLDMSRYKEIKLPNLLLVHWVLNPGLLFNEVILGQRIPKVTLLDQQSSDIYANRGYVLCPHCQSLHSSRRWGKGNAFFHFNGLYCPKCEANIPTLLNVFSIIVLLLTFPIWKPMQMVFGERFKQWEISRLAKTEHLNRRPLEHVSGIKMGLYFGGAMSVFFILQNSFFLGFNTFAVLTGLLTGALAGLLFGTVMKFILSRRGRKSNLSSSSEL
jgi:hypothetical protein